MKEDPARFQKHDEGKARLDLLPPVAIRRVGQVLSFGAAKYDAENWRRVDDRRRYLAAALRHLNLWAEGEELAHDSGLPHLAHAATSVLFLLECQEVGHGVDTRPSRRGPAARAAGELAVTFNADTMEHNDG